MFKLKLLLVIAGILMLAQISSAQNWATLPFKLSRHTANYYIDSQENVMYMSGNFDSVNGVKANIIKWDGVNVNYFNSPGQQGGHLLVFQGKLHTNMNGLFFRKEDTGWLLTNPYYRDVGPTFPCGDKLLASQIVKDTITWAESMTIATWDGFVWKDSIFLDTLWGAGQQWGFQSMAWYKGELYLGGNMNPSAKPLISEIVRFDGRNFKDVGGGIQNGAWGGVSGMLVWKGDLYVYGEFLEWQGAPGNCIARWDGNNWHRLAGGATRGSSEAEIQRAAIFNDELYIVGKFNEIDGISADGIAKWNGRKWCTVNDDFDHWKPHDITTFKNNLYISGGWYAINSDSSFNHLAKMTSAGLDDTCSLPLSVPSPFQQSKGSIYPNPTSNFIFTQHTGITWVDVIDMTGRKVLTAPYLKVGVNVSTLEEGLYLVKLYGPDITHSAKLIKRN